jgi:hypothetical protein
MVTVKFYANGITHQAEMTVAEFREFIGEKTSRAFSAASADDLPAIPQPIKSFTQPVSSFARDAFPSVVVAMKFIQGQPNWRHDFVSVALHFLGGVPSAKANSNEYQRLFGILSRARKRIEAQCKGGFVATNETLNLASGIYNVKVYTWKNE